jgi:hypothetical protein
VWTISCLSLDPCPFLSALSPDFPPPYLLRGRRIIGCSVWWGGQDVSDGAVQGAHACLSVSFQRASQTMLRGRLCSALPPGLPASWPPCLFLHGAHLTCPAVMFGCNIQPNSQFGCRNQSPERTSNFSETTQVRKPCTSLYQASHLPTARWSSPGLPPESDVFSTVRGGESHVPRGRRAESQVSTGCWVRPSLEAVWMNRAKGWICGLLIPPLKVGTGRLSHSQPNSPVARPVKLSVTQGHLASVGNMGSRCVGWGSCRFMYRSQQWLRDTATASAKC